VVARFKDDQNATSVTIPRWPKRPSDSTIGVMTLDLMIDALCLWYQKEIEPRERTLDDERKKKEKERKKEKEEEEEKEKKEQEEERKKKEQEKPGEDKKNKEQDKEAEKRKKQREKEKKKKQEQEQKEIEQETTERKQFKDELKKVVSKPGTALPVKITIFDDIIRDRIVAIADHYNTQTDPGSSNQIPEHCECPGPDGKTEKLRNPRFIRVYKTRNWKWTLGFVGMLRSLSIHVQRSMQDADEARKREGSLGSGHRFGF
jgi:hypothetical protein